MIASSKVPKTASGRKSYSETGFAGKNQSNLENMNANSLEFRYRCSYRFDEWKDCRKKIGSVYIPVQILSEWQLRYQHLTVQGVIIGPENGTIWGTCISRHSMSTKNHFNIQIHFWTWEKGIASYISFYLIKRFQMPAYKHQISHLLNSPVRDETVPSENLKSTGKWELYHFSVYLAI